MIEGQNLDQAKRHPDVVKNIIKKDGRKGAIPYSSSNPPPYPVTSVNGQEGDVLIPQADTSSYGITKLNSATNSTSTTEAATPSAVKGAYDLASSTDASLKTYTRPNLLKNWYFVGGGSQQGWGYFPINSNGQTSYSGNAYALDKWFCGNITSAISSGYVTFTNGNSYRDGFSQDINKEALFGKKLTGTILLSDGNLYTGTATAPNSNVSSTQYFAFIDYDGNTIRLRCQASVWMFESMIKASSSLSVVAVKLEVGETQTLAHQVNGSWVLNEIPQFDDEYARSTGLVYTYSRENLLDNWYFVGGGSQQGALHFPINSKGQTSYSIPAARTPCIDRWYGYDGQGSGSIQIVSGGVKLTKTLNADGIYFGQSGVCDDLTGKTVTLSILTSTGALYSGTATVPKSNIIAAYPNFAAGVTIESGKVVVQFYSYASTVTVVAAKLELGDTQTLAHQVNGSWVLNEVPKWKKTAPAVDFDIVTVSIGNISANSYASAHTDVTFKSGYDFFAVVPQYTNVGYPVAGTYLDGNPPSGMIRVVAGVMNNSSSTLNNVTATVRVLWSISKN